MASGSGGHGTEDVLGALAAGRDLEGGGSGHAHGPTADLSVRPAVPEDAALITDLQLAAWRTRGLLEEDQVAMVDTGAVRDQWHAAITNPPSPRHRVLTACAGADVVGFLAFAPAEAQLPEAAGTEPVEVIALEVSAARTREGHGARLLAACADLAGEAGATSMSTWAGPDDDARTRFLDSAGFAPAGQRRTLDAPGGEVVEHLWFTLI